MKNNLLLLFFALLCQFNALRAQDGFEEVKIETQKVTEKIYMLTGAGGNMVISTGKVGVFMIDDQFAPLSERIQNAISELSDKKVSYLVNTYWHGDHTGGNENFGGQGAVFVAHENVRKRMSTEQMIQAFGKTVAPSPATALPVITFSEDLTFHFNDEAILVFHVHNAHTDGDGMIYFSKSNVLHMGDTYFQGRFPFLDVSSGGTIDGMIQAANAALFVIDEETRIIPGHGALSNKKELMEYRDMLMGVRGAVKRALAKGMTLEEMQAAKITLVYDEQWGGGFIKPDKIIDIIYTDLSR